MRRRLIGKDPDAGKDWRQEEKGMTEDEMVGWHHQLDGWVWVSSRSWWWTGKPGVLHSMGSQRVRHDWATELNLTWIKNYCYKQWVGFLPWKLLPGTQFCGNLPQTTPAGISVSTPWPQPNFCYHPLYPQIHFGCFQYSTYILNTTMGQVPILPNLKLNERKRRQNTILGLTPSFFLDLVFLIWYQVSISCIFDITQCNLVNFLSVDTWITKY